MGTLRGHRRRSRTAPLLVVLATLNFSAASLVIAAPAVQQLGRAAVTRRETREHDISLSTARAVAGLRAIGTRGGASGDTGKGSDEPPAPPAGGLTATAKELLSKLLDVVGTMMGKVGSGSGDGGGRKTKAKAKSSKKSEGKSNGRGFKGSFEAKYGKSHPKFNEKSFADATEHAWTRNRLCLVYIAAERGAGGKAVKIDDAICKALADPKVATFVDANFVTWVPGGKTAAQLAASSAAAAKRVGARSLPFLGVVNSASTTDKMTLERTLERSTVGLHHCKPPPSPDQMVSWVTRVLDLNKGLLETELAEQQRLRDEDTIFTERVEGYSKSLKDDALREVREKEEEAERARLEEEERVAQEAREAKEREDVERRERKAEELGQEPAESAAKGEGTASTLMLRLADGSRVRRRFLRSDPMGKVLDWADVQGVDLEAQRLSSSFPKASFSHPGDSAVTIEDAGLGKQALLFVEQKPKEAVSQPGTEDTGDLGADGAADEL